MVLRLLEYRVCSQARLAEAMHVYDGSSLTRSRIVQIEWLIERAFRRAVGEVEFAQLTNIHTYKKKLLVVAIQPVCSLARCNDVSGKIKRKNVLVIDVADCEAGDYRKMEKVDKWSCKVDRITVDKDGCI